MRRSAPAGAAPPLRQRRRPRRRRRPPPSLSRRRSRSPKPKPRTPPSRRLRPRKQPTRQLTTHSVMRHDPAIGSDGGIVRLRFDIAYDGTDFAGWAVQGQHRTVAGLLDDALSTVFRTPVRLFGAGRTDTGVHATGQVAHVDVPVEALPHARPRIRRASDAGAGVAAEAPQEFLPLLRRLARFLPDDVRVREIRRAPTGFDARFSALRRHYVYRLSTAPYGVEPQLSRYVTPWPRALDVDAMNKVANDMLGLRDFAAFCRKRHGATTIRD